jgi:hypothetical protein
MCTRYRKLGQFFGSLCLQPLQTKYFKCIDQAVKLGLLGTLSHVYLVIQHSYSLRVRQISKYRSENGTHSFFIQMITETKIIDGLEGVCRGVMSK